MTKDEAIKMLGGTPKLAAKAMGYKVPQTISVWPDPLPTSISDRVRGAALRLKESKKAKKAEATE